MDHQSTTAHYAGSLSRAWDVRGEVLDRLGAEDEWIEVDDEGLVVTWCAGPAPTRLELIPAVELPLDLTILRVVTLAAYVDDAHAARLIAWSMNGYSTLNRWVMYRDAGPPEWTAQLTDERLAAWADEIHAGPASGERPVLALEATFVFADPADDLPSSVIAMVAREQISKVNALTTNNAWEDPEQIALGETIVGGINGTVRTEDWNDVLFHHDNLVAPRRNMSPAGVFAALAHAKERSVSRLEDAGFAAWFGTAGPSVVNWEVPYGPGPFPGVVVSAITPSPGCATSFVQAFPLAGDGANPHHGNGVLITMKLGGFPSNIEDLLWNAMLLNNLSHTQTPQGFAFSAHGIGAWNRHQTEVVWSLFVPSHWSDDIPPSDLARFMDVVMANTARLSWMSRLVLEPPGAAGAPQPGGFAAGSATRGPSFGEPAPR